MKLFAVLFMFSLAVSAYAADTKVSSTCLRCLCEGSTSNCDKNAGCDSYGFCGPFRISQKYWEEAGSFEGDFKKCVNEYNCAEKTVKSYMEKYGKDCDGDGDTDCMDFALIHHKGKDGCPYTDFQSDSLYKYVKDCMVRHKDDDKHDESFQAGQRTSSNLGENVREGLDNVKEKSGDLKDNVQEKSGDLKDRVKGQSDNIRDKASDFKDDLKDRSKNIGENIKEKYHDTKDMLSQRASDVKEGVKEGAKNIKDKLTMDKQHESNIESAKPSDPVHRELSLEDKSRLHDDRPNLDKGKDTKMPLHEMIRQRRQAMHF
jgi:gas vesicle protein